MERARGRVRELVVGLGAVVVAATLLPLVAAAPAAAAPAPVRLAGGDAAETAAAVSKAGWVSSSEAVIVATGAWTDALAAASLGMPILLTKPDTLPASSAAELRRLGVRRVWVVGGSAAVGDAVRTQLRGLGATLTEVSGADRYDTAGRLAALLPPSGDVVVASGEAWADASSIAAWAGTRRAPVLLTRRDALPPTSDAARGATRTIVVGGVNVVSDAVVASLPNPIRLAGADRYGTNAQVVQWTTAQGLRFDQPVIAPGTSPMDALVAGPLAGRRASPVLLTAPGRLPVDVQHVVVQRAQSVQSLAVVGGAAGVSDAAVTDAVASVSAADLVGWVNTYRAENGRSSLGRDGDQTEHAFTHAVALGGAGRLFHQAPTCATWGEDVGTAPDARRVFDLWTQDAAHRTVMLMSAVTRVGTAVATSSDGRRWVVLDVCS